MNAAQYAQLPEVWRAACRHHLASSVLLIVHRDLSYAGQFGERAAILCDGQPAHRLGAVPGRAGECRHPRAVIHRSRRLPAPGAIGGTSDEALRSPTQDEDEEADDLI